MNNQNFKLSLLVISLLAARGSIASATFTGDTNQNDSGDQVIEIIGDIIVGNTDAGDIENPNGTLVINNGTVLNGSRYLTIGRLPGTAGRVDISGPGSELNLSRALYVGDQGSGVMNISDGAKVTSNSWGGNSGYIGTRASTKGIVTVSGMGSSWTTNGTIDVGTEGEGVLVVSDHADVNVGLSLWVGRNDGSRGSLLVTDGGVLNVGANFLVGIHGDGSAEISNGGIVNTKVAMIGEDKDNSYLLITGQGAQLNTGEYLNVGQQNGTASLVVANGAKVTTSLNGSTPGSTNGFDIGFVAGDSGNVLITGKESVISTFGKTGLSDPNSTNSSSIGKNGSGVLTLQDGGTLETYNVWVAASADSSGVINIGAAKGEAAADAGKLTTDDNGAINVGLGTAEINFNHTDSNYMFGSAITGGSSLLSVNIDSGTTILSGKNTYTGTTNVNSGELRAGAENTFSSRSDFIVKKGGLLALNDHNQNIQSLFNAGLVSLGDTNSGAVLTVSGNYTGDNGLMVFNSVLGGDDSATDRLVITGDTYGSTRVAVNNLGGSGSKTIKGIELITVSGNSAGDFTQDGRIVAGAYDYHLTRGAGENAGNWYLSNLEADPGPRPGPEPTDPGPGPGAKPMVLRPEAGAYAANVAAAANLFQSTIDDRPGETEYTDAVTGERRLTSLWMKNVGGHSRLRDGSGQLNTHANRYSVMLGGDLATGSSSRGDTWRLGALAGYGNSHSKTRSGITGANAKGDVSGYTTGLYGTWFADGSSERGLYIDTVLQYAWFDNVVKGEDLQGEKYRAGGISTAIETGYVFPLEGEINRRWFIQPKATAAWSGVKAHEHQEANGTRVNGTGNNNLFSSVGVKAFMKGFSKRDAGRDRFFKPFAEINWIHNTESYGVKMDGVTVSPAGTRNAGEVKLGVEGRLTPHLNLTGYARHRFGSSEYADTSAVLGVKYTFR